MRQSFVEILIAGMAQLKSLARFFSPSQRVAATIAKPAPGLRKFGLSSAF
jgi:hypothetical protein